MSDLISRHTAIDAAERESQVDGAYGYMDTKSIVDMLNELPSAQPEQKHGRWIKDCNVAFYWKCSECGAYLFWRKEDYLLRKNDNLNYCPNCGARMEEQS